LRGLIYGKNAQDNGWDFGSDSIRSEVGAAKKPRPKMELLRADGLIPPNRRTAMLVERGLQVMNVEVVGDAYAIASNYLRRTGAIADSLATDDRLLAIIVQMFERGEFNKIRLANKAIARFEAEELV
jgi:hypothetical protein